jgi:HSP20 family protein
MSDTNKSQFKQTLLSILILLLFLLVGYQAWYMFEMKKQLDVLHQQQSPVMLQAQGTIVNEKNIAEQKLTVANNTEELADEQQSSLQEKQNAPSTQSQNKSLSPDSTPPLILPPSSDTTFGGQAWNPYREIERMQDDMDRTFNRRFNRFNNRPGFNEPGFNNPSANRPDFEYHFSQNISTPEIDIKENANQYTVLVNLPGADKKDISVTLHGQRLNIKGKQDYKKQNRDAMGNIIFQARQSGRFQRGITLSKPVDQNKMKTRLENGVLIIIIPKVQNSQWR